MSPLLKTFLLVIIALGMSAGAASVYPWAETETKSSNVGEPLFEDYEPTTVRRIKIERFDTKTGKLTTIVARRKGDQWLLPDKDNFVTTNARHIAQVTNSLLKREVLEEKTNKEIDHATYGVIDPALHESTANKSALGIKITLEDASKKPIANLIVGKPAEKNARNSQTQKRFVSVPGSPNVYMIEINPFALTTAFEAWIERNLFQLSQQIDSVLFFEKAGDSSKELTYKLTYDLTVTAAPDKLPSARLQQANEKGELVDAVVADASQQSVEIMIRQLASLLVSNAFANDKTVKQAISDSQKTATAAEFNSLKSRGIRFVSDKQAQLILAGSQGKIGVEYSTGLVITMYLGNALADIDATEERPAHYGLLVATVDESLIETPAEPKPDENADADEAEKQKKAYLLAVKEREDTLKSSRVSANEFNQQHAGWLYAVPKPAVNNLFPVLEAKAQP